MLHSPKNSAQKAYFQNTTPTQQTVLRQINSQAHMLLVLAQQKGITL